MAATARGARLTQLHRQAQLALRARLLRDLMGVWQFFDPSDVDASWARLEPVVLALASNGRAASAQIAAAYYRGFRATEGIEGRPPIITLDDSWQEPARVSFRVTGPVAAKKFITLNRPDVARQAYVSLAGSFGRWVLDAGRETVVQTALQDSQAMGWFRVTASDPCAFCAMLASRGPVYRSREAASFPAHDMCACTAEPRFVDGAHWPGRGREWQRLWSEVTRDTKGQESIRAFRRAYEGRSN